jgi:hypothetical protein
MKVRHMKRRQRRPLAPRAVPALSDAQVALYSGMAGGTFTAEVAFNLYAYREPKMDALMVHIHSNSNFELQNAAAAVRAAVGKARLK